MDVRGVHGGCVHGGYVHVCTCEDVYTWECVPGGHVHVRGVHVRVFA